jgi:hypothetical protein
MRKGLLAAAGFWCLATAAPTYAADNGIYLGASVGQSNVELDDEIDFAADATGYKVILGWRPLDWLAVEGNYVDLGSGDDSVAGEKVESDIDGLTLSAVGFLPVGPVDMYARAGVIDWDAEVRVPDLDIRSEGDGTDLAYGVGVQFRVWGLSIRGEYERFEIDDADRVDFLSVGLTYTFL